MELSKVSKLESIYKNKFLIFQKTLNNFVKRTNLIPKIGLELEFYLTHKNGSAIEKNSSIIEEFITDLTLLSKKFDFVYKIEKEQGVGQIEVKTKYDADLIKICDQILEIKDIARNLALKKELFACFAAQPFINDCGSSLQFNISLHNQKEENLFLHKSELLNSVIASLLNFTEQTLPIFASSSEDYLRFNERINQELYKKGKYPAPINLSFGFENRTCAIRIPFDKNSSKIIKEKDCANYKKRVEYRIASANSDPYLSISAILMMLLKGMEQNLLLKDLGFEQIYGNAFDKQYNLKPFAKSYEEALDKFNYNFFDL